MKSILFITYIDFGSYKSGSSVRPQMMAEAFASLNINTIILSTEQNKGNERKKAVSEIFEYLKHNKVDYCYVESPSGPIFQACDIALLKHIHKLNIPIAYFYRDCYFLYKDEFKTKNSFIKDKVIEIMSKNQLKLLDKICSIVYFPTKTMASLFAGKYLKNAILKDLPPACSAHLSDKRGTKVNNKSIYVGGVSDGYGINIMLDGFMMLNQEENYPLTICCRESEVKNLDKYKDEKWLKIVHANGKDNLKKLYDEHAIAIRCVQKNKYNDFAFSVKLTEYMEFNMPMVSIDTVEASNFIKKYDLGLICKDTSLDLAKKVKMLLDDENLYQNFTNSIYKAVDQNLWKDRAKQVDIDMSAILSNN